MLQQMTLGEKVDLLERVERSLDTKGKERTPEGQREALLKKLEHAASLPVENPTADWTNRDHDKILYGGPT